MNNEEPPLWRAIVSRLRPAPESMSIDSVTAALGGAVGRGTVQRIKEGVPGTSMKSLNAIAAHLGCSVSELFEGDSESAPPAVEAKEESPQTVRQALFTIRAKLMHAHPEQAERIGEALKLMAAVPDSDRAFEQAVALLTR